ncbi:hypothetical protein ACFLVE_02360 [Chloroflexota bacterium]
MDFFQSISAVQIIFILAVINLLSGALILLSCRCIPGLKISGTLMKNRRISRNDMRQEIRLLLNNTSTR